MARVTVEDCVEKVPNRFELVMLAAHRSRDLSSGAPLSLDRDNDRNPVVALREIAEETVVIDGLRDALIRGLQKHVELDEPEEDMLELMSSDELLGAAGVLAGEGGGPAEAPAPRTAGDAGAPDDAAETPDADQATERE